MQTKILRVISRKAIVEFAKTHADSLPPLTSWYATVTEASWTNFAELRADFPSADQLGRRTVFNIGGNKYRLISRVNYRFQKVYVLAILTHAKYDEGRWK